MENTGATLTGKASVDKPWLQFYPEDVYKRQHYNALNEDVKLRISLELYLKRLIVGGLERVYAVSYTHLGPASSGKLARKLSGRISSSCYSAAQEAMSGVDNTGEMCIRDSNSSAAFSTAYASSEISNIGISLMASPKETILSQPSKRQSF